MELNELIREALYHHPRFLPADWRRYALRSVQGGSKALPRDSLTLALDRSRQALAQLALGWEGEALRLIEEALDLYPSLRRDLLGLLREHLI